MIAGVSVFALNGVAQIGPGGPRPGAGPMDPPPEVIPPDIELPPELMELRTSVQELRTALWESREAVLAALGEDATMEERRAALEEWRASAETQALIADVQAAAESLHGAMAEYFPENPWFDSRPPIPDEIQQAREALVQNRATLRETRRAAIEALGPDATFEERQEALAQWRLENAVLIEETRQIAEQVRTWFRENRPGRADRPEDAMFQRRQAFHESAAEMRQLRNEFRNRLEGATEEERAQLMEQFRQEQRELMRERRELKRQERLNDAGEGGDRRPGGEG